MMFYIIKKHNYQKLNLGVIQKVIEEHLEDFEEFLYEVNRFL